MKLYFSLFIYVFCISAKAQNCETINNKLINCIDKDSLKQGFWYERIISKILRTDSLRINPNAIGYHNESGLVEIPQAEGIYKNNRRVGEWKFYKGVFYNDIMFCPTSHEQIAIFSDTGNFKVNDSFWYFTADVSYDSSNLVGQIVFRSDTIKLICKNKLCEMKDPLRKYKVIKFPLKELDAKLILFKLYTCRDEMKRQKLNSKGLL